MQLTGTKQPMNEERYNIIRNSNLWEVEFKDLNRAQSYARGRADMAGDYGNYVEGVFWLEEERLMISKIDDWLKEEEEELKASE